MSQTKTRLPPGLKTFPKRLSYALGIRTEMWSVSQNEIARRAGVDSGNLAKYLDGQRLEKLAAKTIIGLADALKVRLEWLLAGIEPSGLEATPTTAPPSSAVRESQPPKATA